MPAQRQTRVRRLPEYRGLRWVWGSYCLKEYELCASDLASLVPIEIRTNTRRPEEDIMKYAEDDVEELYRRLRPNFGPDERAEEDGEQMTRSDARRHPFLLKDVQINRIKPTKVVDGVKYYNVKDVQELSNKIYYAALHPT